jgi:hypothetical protein
MRLTTGLRVVCLLIPALALLPGESRGQECPHGRISYVFVDNRSIFDLAELDPDARFRWAYRLANKLHVRTRKEFILDELLFQSGDCLDPLLLEESGRLLRAHRFIGQSDVFAIPQPDGTHHVNVYTQDEWTTRVDLGMRVDDGFRFTGLDVSEENLLGRGLLVRLFFREDREQEDRGFEFETPRLLGTRWGHRLSFGTTRNGRFFQEALYYPFVGEVGRVGARQSFLWRETLFSYALPEHPRYTHLLVPFLDERADVTLGFRLGEPGNLTVLGVGVSRESIRFQDFPTGTEYVVGRDFSVTEPVDSAGVEAIRGQALTRRANRLNVFLGQRNIRFVQRRGLDSFKGIQDVQTGTELMVGLGRAPKLIQEGGAPVRDDLHTQASLFAGGAWGPWTLNALISAEARQVYFPGGGRSEWDDIFAEADVFLYWQPPGATPHTFLARLSGAGGWSLTTPFQLTLGGRNALRGYREEEFPGSHRLLLTLEDRIYVPWPAPELFDFGLSLFLDLGHIQAGEVPFGTNAGWKASLGGGIRFGLPPGTTTMARVDLAVPLHRKARPGDILLRVSLRELLGILPGFRDDQMLRSRRSGMRPGLVSPPR